MVPLVLLLILVAILSPFGLLAGYLLAVSFPTLIAVIGVGAVVISMTCNYLEKRRH
jgi:hypothetical protein